MLSMAQQHMASTISATKAKNNFGELMRKVYRTGDCVIVEKDGIPVVIIGPITEPDLRKQYLDRKIPQRRGNKGDSAQT